jgi:hypothetical protein
MTELGYRKLAQTHVDAAKTLLSSGKVEELKYAALELRMALEALIYDVASHFSDDFPQKHDNWKPKKLLEQLIAIDELCDKSLEFHIREHHDGQADDEGWALIGEENRLSLKDVKKPYESLGSFLHTPTIKQLGIDSNYDAEKIRRRCEAAKVVAETVLSSTVWGLHLNSRTSIFCISCEAKITRRVNNLVDENELPLPKMSVNCSECDATYLITKEDGKIRWEPQCVQVPCLSSSCDGQSTVWPRSIRYGKLVKCKICSAEGRFDILLNSTENDPPPPLSFTLPVEPA